MTYMNKIAQRKSKYIHVRKDKKPVHLKFDEAGNVLNGSKSKALNKAKGFLGKLKDNTQPESGKKEYIEFNFPSDFAAQNDIEEIGDTDDSESDEVGGKEKLTVSNSVDNELNSSNDFPSAEERVEPSVICHESDDEVILLASETAANHANCTGSETKTEVTYSEGKAEVLCSVDTHGEGTCGVEEGSNCNEGDSANVSLSPMKKKRKKKRRGNKRERVAMPEEVANDPELQKYWKQRYRLFSRFDEGVRLDRGKDDG